MSHETVETKTMKDHAELFDRMGTAVGLDLQDEAISGNLVFDEIADAVVRCTKCGQPEACKTWLNEIEGQPSVMKSAPDYCRNLDLFDFLKEERGD